MNAPILSVRSLSIRYGKVEAVHHVSLEVRVGQIVTVIGPNGAGKSTLLGGIMGALPFYSSASGEIVYGGDAVARRPVEERVAAGMCLVPE
ncbi:MAG: ATP-binding cassette domain-containing protein, partial [Sulfurifustis sp.]